MLDTVYVNGHLQIEKVGLYRFAKSKNVGISNENMQLEYLLGELGIQQYAKGFATPITWSYKGYSKTSWQNATSPEEAAKAFSYWFESPAVYNGNDREPKAREYYEKFKDLQRSSVAYIDASAASAGVRGTVTLPNGKVATIFDQTARNASGGYVLNWGSRCNRAAAGIICSINTDNSTTSNMNLVNTLNSDYSMYGGTPFSGYQVPPEQFFNKYGFTIAKEECYEGMPNDAYIQPLRDLLSSGGYAMIWVNISGRYGNGGTYIGKSGEKWTGQFHWFPVLAYDSNTDSILIADWKRNNWFTIDEFTTHGIVYLIHIRER